MTHRTRVTKLVRVVQYQPHQRHLPHCAGRRRHALDNGAFVCPSCYE